NGNAMPGGWRSSPSPRWTSRTSTSDSSGRTVAPTPSARRAVRHFLRSYALLLTRNLVRQRYYLPLMAVIQTLLAGGVILGFSFLIPQADPESDARRPGHGRTVGVRSGGREELLHLRDGRVRQGGTVREQDRGHRPVAAVDAGDVLGSLGLLLDVDDLLGDSLAVQLGGEPAAVAAPGGRVHRQHGGR